MMHQAFVLILFLPAAMAVGSFHKMNLIGSPNIDGIKQKPGLSKVECVLVCQIKNLLSIMTEDGCICFENVYASSLNVEDESSSRATFFESLNPSPVECDHRLITSGWSSSYPAKSCKKIKEQNPCFNISGFYWIQLDQPTRVYCDMVTDGGGWMMITNITSTATSNQYGYEYLVQNTAASSLSILSQVENGRTLLDDKKLADLDGYIDFSQIRVFCAKPYHGRTVHMISKADLLKKYVIGEIDQWIPTGACTSGIYFRPDDNSNIRQACLINHGIACNPYLEPNDSRLYGHFYYQIGTGTILLLTGRMECDDTLYTSGYNKIGIWNYFVR